MNYLVKAVYGFEAYQIEEKEFENEKDAWDYYDECKAKNPIRVSIYRVIGISRNE